MPEEAGHSIERRSKRDAERTEPVSCQRFTSSVMVFVSRSVGGDLLSGDQIGQRGVTPFHQSLVAFSYILVDRRVAFGYIVDVKPITYRPTAVKALRRMPANTARRIVGKIEAYVADPSSQANNVKKLQGRDGIRLRVGDWRVIMIDGEVLEVLDIGPRGGIYD